MEKKSELEKTIEELGTEFQRLLKTNSDVAFALAEFTRSLIALAETKTGESFMKLGESYGRLLAMYFYYNVSPAHVVENAFALAVDFVMQFKSGKAK